MEERKQEGKNRVCAEEREKCGEGRWRGFQCI